MFVRAAQKLDIDITIASERPNSLSHYLPVDLVTLDFNRPLRCADAMRDFAKKHPIDAVIGVDDQVTLAAAAIGEALSLPHNPIAAARASRDKYKMRTRLAKGDVPQPDFQLLSIRERGTRAALGLSYPCVVKPLMMAASRGVIRADTPEDFVTALRKISCILNSKDAPTERESREHILVEEYVSGWEVAVEGMLTNGRLDVFAIFDKPDPLEGPYFPETIYVTPSRLRDQVQERIVSITQEAALDLGLRQGPIHAELRGDADHLWFIEMAARSIGGYCSKVLRFDDGLSLEDVIIGHALGGSNYQLPERLSGAAGVMMLQAPRTGRFIRAVGIKQARAVPGIEEIIVSSHPGQVLTPLPEGFLYLGFVFARADTPQQVEKALRRAYERLEFVIEPSD